MNADKILVVVPARGGSSRIQRKAMADVLGAPLLWYTLRHCDLDGLLPRTVVITDDAEIAEYAVRSGAEASVEPPVQRESTANAIAFALHDAQERLGMTAEIVVALQPNCPVRPQGVVLAAVDALEADPKAAMCVGLVESPVRPEFLVSMDPGGRVRRRGGDWSKRTQENEPSYVLSGAVYAAWSVWFRLGATNRLWDELWPMIGLVHDGPLCDIDGPDDLLWFEHLVKSGRFAL